MLIGYPIILLLEDKIELYSNNPKGFKVNYSLIVEFVIVSCSCDLFVWNICRVATAYRERINIHCLGRGFCFPARVLVLLNNSPEESRKTVWCHHRASTKVFIGAGLPTVNHGKKRYFGKFHVFILFLKCWLLLWQLVIKSGSYSFSKHLCIYQVIW